MFSAIVGWAVVLVGVVSAATMLRGFVGYLGVFIVSPDWLVILSCVALLTAIAIWGIGESLLAAAAITLLEIAGLLFVCIVAGDSFADFGQNWRLALPGPETTAGVISGAFIAFYAFIGFEDIVNVAEEVRNARTNLPRAIVLSLVVSTVLYLLVAAIASRAIPSDEIAMSDAPLAAIIESRGYPPGIIAGISLFAVINGALVQIIMASRVLYGLARNGQTYTGFGKVHRTRRTPVTATLFIGCLLLILALFFSLSGLARATSLLALAIFAVVNLSLWRLKHVDKRVPNFSVPRSLPMIGTIICLSMIAIEGLTVLQ